MKNFTKLLIFVLMVTMTVNGYSQTFGIKGGLNLANSHYKDDGGSLSYKMLPGFNFGVTGEFPINQMLFFETGLSISIKGAKRSETYQSVKYDYKHRLTYLEVPLTAKAKFEMGKAKFYGLFGPYLAYGIGGQYYENGVGTKIKWGTDENKDDLKPLDYGLNIGVGVEFDALQIGLTYGLGLANISAYTGEGSKMSNNVIGLSIGYRFLK